MELLISTVWVALFIWRLPNVMQMYEPVTEGSYIKMIDMVSGRGKMEVSFLSCKNFVIVKELDRRSDYTKPPIFSLHFML